ERAPAEWLHQVLRQVRQADYNPLPMVPLTPVYLLMGSSRPVYISALVALYLVPVCFMFAYLARRLADARLSSQAAWLALGVALLYVPFWRPTLRGLPDIVGLVPILAALILVLKHD